MQQVAKSAEVAVVIGCVDTRKARRAIKKWALHFWVPRSVCFKLPVMAQEWKRVKVGLRKQR